MTVAELIEWLKTQDQEAEVTVVNPQSGGNNGTLFDPEHHAYYTDFRGNQFVRSDEPYYNKRYLELGYAV